MRLAYYGSGPTSWREIINEFGARGLQNLEKTNRDEDASRKKKTACSHQVSFQSLDLASSAGKSSPRTRRPTHKKTIWTKIILYVSVKLLGFSDNSWTFTTIRNREIDGLQILNNNWSASESIHFLVHWNYSENVRRFNFPFRRLQYFSYY